MKKKAVLLFLSVLCSCFIFGCEKAEESKEPWGEYFSLFGLHDDEVVERLGEGEILYEEGAGQKEKAGRFYSGNPYTDQGTTELRYGIDSRIITELPSEEISTMERYVVHVNFRIPQKDDETKMTMVQDLEEKFGEPELLQEGEYFNGIWLHDEFFISLGYDYAPITSEVTGLSVGISYDDGDWQHLLP